MVTRLSASDASFYHLEDTSTPMYVGSLSILRKPRSGLSYETLLATVEQRLPQIPRYRQKVREVTLGLARPVWVDDRDFDITYHIRRSALPSPGSDAQLHELIARLGSRPLDKSRPLWEMYLIEGLARNRVAVYTKTHQALVNGMTALEIGHVIADRTQKPPEFGEDIWIPAREPSDRRLVLGAIGEWVTRPAEQLGAVRSAVTEVATNSGQLVEVGRRVRRRRTDRRARHRAEQPAEHDGVAQPSLHRGQRPAGGLPLGAGPLRLRRQRRRARGGRGRVAQLAAVARRAGDVHGDGAGDGADVGVSRRRSGNRQGQGRPSARCRRSWSTCPSERATRWCGCRRSRMPRSRIDRGQPRRCQDHRHAVGFRATDVARHGNSRRDHVLGAAVQLVDHQCAWRAEADVSSQAPNSLRRTRYRRC